MESKEDCLSKFRKSCDFANVKLCVKCRRNVTNRMAQEVQSQDDVFLSEELHLPEKCVLLRMGKFWVCSSCSSMTGDIPKKKIATLKLNMVRTENEKLFVPQSHQYNISRSASESQGTPSDSDNSRIPILVFMPSSVKALDLYPELNIESISSSQVLTSVYSGDVKQSDIEVYHQVQLHKYYNAQKSSDIVFGFIEDESRRFLSSVVQDTQESKIHGSDKWITVFNEDIKWRLKGYGPYFIRVVLNFPFNADEVIATNLVQDGFTVTVTMESNSEGEYLKEYWVHTGKPFSKFSLID